MWNELHFVLGSGDGSVNTNITAQDEYNATWYFLWPDTNTFYIVSWETG